jgi:Fic-DOC domain mobile mystery protein B
MTMLGTPLSPEELADLLPNLATKEELNEWERENILRAREWATADRTSPVGMASDEYVRKLHTKMFDQTWKWAGEYRRTDKNIGVSVHEIRDGLMVLCGDVRYWIDNSTHCPDEIAVRFHHRLAFIHPFPNGNGRHARLIADVLVMKLGRPAFTWGSANLVKEGEARTKYLQAIRAADNGDFQLLLEFARS